MATDQQSVEAGTSQLIDFVRHLPVAVAMFDSQMRYLEASERWCADYALAHDAIIGRSHYQVFPNPPAGSKAAHQRALHGESLSEDVEAFTRRDGRKSWLRWDIRPWGESGEGPRGIFIFTEDITERKQASDALVQAVCQYRDLADNSPDMIVRFDTQGRYTFVNRRFLHVTGLRELDFIGKQVGSVVANNPASAQWLAAIMAAVRSGKAHILESIFRIDGDGVEDTLWEARFVPETKDDLPVQSVLMIATDITARRRAEGRAQAGEQEARERGAIITALFDTASQAIFGIDREGNILLANRMVEEMFGYAPGELMGQPHDILLPAAIREKHAQLRERFFQAPARRPMGAGMELQAQRKDGSTFPVEVNLSAVDTADGPIAVSFLTDITLRTQQQAALRKSEQELRRLSEALLTAEEDVARQIARELHDDITQRLALMSMEIGRNAGQAVAHELVADLRTYQERILNICESIRRISHAMHPAILDDLGLAAALESLCMQMEKAQGFPVVCEVGSLPVKIAHAAAYTLYRVCQESLLNVSKHANASQVYVTLSQRGDSLSLEVADDGSGFDPAAQKVGLGTLTMKERVRLAGGTLDIRSSPEAGTTVIARVPVQAS